jgi:O-antigen/teichoic acid export membrane protein
VTTREQQVRNSVIYLLPVVVASAVPLLTLPIYTRLLSPQDFGAWALCLAYAMFLTGLANFGLTIGYERNFFEHTERDSQAKLLYSTLAFVLAAFVICTAFTWAFSERITAALTGSGEHAWLLVCTTAAHAVMSLKAYYLIYFRNTAQARAHVWYSVDELVAAAALGVLFIVAFDSGVIGIPLGQLIASMIVFAALTRRFARDLPFAFSRHLLKEELAVSYPLTPRILVGVAGNQADKYLLGLLGTLGGVGVYTVGQRLAHMVFTFMTALENVFNPQVYERMFKLGPDGGAAIGRYLTPFAYLSVLAALTLGLFAEEGILLLTPPEFHAAIPIAGILCLHYGIMFFGKLPQLVYAKRTGLISAVTVFGLVAHTGLNILFIRRWGALGAASGTLVAGILSVLLVAFLGQKFYPIRWQYGAIITMFGLLFAGVIGSVWLREAGFGYPVRLAVKLGTLGAYAAAGVALGIASRENAMMARAALGSKPRIGSLRT